MATMVTDDFVQFSQTATFVDKTTSLTFLKAGRYSKGKVENPTLDDVVDPCASTGSRERKGSLASNHIFKWSSTKIPAKTDIDEQRGPVA